jgi:homoserine dehydrogenase
MSTIKIGLLGLGTVGSGVYQVLKEQADVVYQKLGKHVEISKILVQNMYKEREVAVPRSLLTTSFDDILESKVDVVVEVMGGIYPAFDYIRRSFQAGCHVVTANKELLAKKGKELTAWSNDYHVHFYYEASVGAGIPVVNVIRHMLQTNQFRSIQGILNGTTNFILGQMEEQGMSYDEALRLAQQLGFAEADPTSDVDGYDALYKAYILAQLSFQEAPAVTDVEPHGIRDIRLADVQAAKELGYRFKLTATATRREVDNRIDLNVQPLLYPVHHPLAQVNGEYNAVQLEGHLVGPLLLSGKGAGKLPTASAVVEDIVYLLEQPFHAHEALPWHEYAPEALRAEQEDRHWLNGSTGDGTGDGIGKEDAPAHPVSCLPPQEDPDSSYLLLFDIADPAEEERLQSIVYQLQADRVQKLEKNNSAERSAHHVFVRLSGSVPGEQQTVLAVVVQGMTKSVYDQILSLCSSTPKTYPIVSWSPETSSLAGFHGWGLSARAADVAAANGTNGTGVGSRSELEKV